MVTAERSYHTTLNSVHKLQQVLQRIAENDGNMIAKEIWREEDIERCALIRLTLHETFLTSTCPLNK